MWAFKRIDWSWSDWGFALGQYVAPLEGEPTIRRIEASWSPAGDAVACLSVRSAFDLFLRAAAWSPGDEVVFTGYTHTAMPQIAREHGLRVRPVDIDPLSTLPALGEVEAAMGQRTRLVVFTHLFGAQMDVSRLRALTEQRGVLLMEDCAQAYSGSEWRGHPESDVAVFSFGPMKSATALGGCLARVRDGGIRERMRQEREGDPEQPGVDYLKRVLIYGALHAATSPTLFGTVSGMAALVGVDHQELGNTLTRAFPESDLLGRIRVRPCPPLAALLERRLRQGAAALRGRARKAERLIQALGARVPVPTGDYRPHAFWMIPVLAADPSRFRAALRSAGFDAMAGRSFGVVADDTGEAAKLSGADRLHREAVYLPFSPGMPDDFLDGMAGRVRDLLTDRS